MQIVINQSEIYYNQKNGIYVQDFWKGPIEINECLIVGNLEYGLHAVNKNAPDLLEDELEILSKFSPEKVNDEK